MRLIPLILLMLMLSACNILKQRPSAMPDSLWQQRSALLQKQSEWAFRGRTAIVQQREGFNASVDWAQRDARFLIRLYGPFAQGGVELAGDDNQVILTLDNGETHSAEHPEALLTESTGMKLPVSALRDWVRGLPYVGLPVAAKSLDEQGRIQTLQQGGWALEFKEYIPFENITMPGKVFIRHADLSIKLIIDDWRRP